MDAFFEWLFTTYHPYGPLLFVTGSTLSVALIAFAFFQTKWGKRFLDGEDYQEEQGIE
jgi:hypothetical protein